MSEKHGTETDTDPLPEAMTRARLHSRVGVRELTKLVGCSHATISRIEARDLLPGAALLARIGSVLGLPNDVMLAHCASRSGGRSGVQVPRAADVLVIATIALQQAGYPVTLRRTETGGSRVEVTAVDGGTVILELKN